MPVIHFLNVGNGDCSIIEHYSGHVSVIDVSCAKTPKPLTEQLLTTAAKSERGGTGNFNQKKYPTNPISYMQKRGITSVFRFILTHPDMDHMDGIEAFFKAFSPFNFWDTDNAEEKNFDAGGGGFQEDDWWFYKGLRDEKPETDPKRLALHSAETGQYYNKGENPQSGGDGLHILAPTRELISAACESEEYNDCSYVILYRTGKWKILFAGDSHDATWEHILAAHKADVTNVDILIAPHHGRESDRDWEFLDIVNPRLTFFGNASSEHLAYQAWSYRGLSIITNNQAGNIIVETNTAATNPQLDIFVTCEGYARSVRQNSFYSAKHDAFYWGSL